MGAAEIIPPTGDDDRKGAERVFQEFFAEYQVVFTKVEVYLGNVIKEVPAYSNAYKPWQKSLRELSRGIYLINKNIPLPNSKSFLEALQMFSFEGAINFLQDICINCHLELGRNWGERFRKHIDMLLFAFSILQRQQQPAYAR